MTAPKPNTVVFAKSVAKLAAFYQATLGMQELEREKGHVLLDGGSYQIVIHAIPKKIADQIHIIEPPQVREESAMKPCYPVASIAEARAQAALHGGQIKPASKEWLFRGLRACDGFDPEGNVFQVRESAALDEVLGSLARPGQSRLMPADI